MAVEAWRWLDDSPMRQLSKPRDQGGGSGSWRTRGASGCSRRARGAAPVPLQCCSLGAGDGVRKGELERREQHIIQRLDLDFEVFVHQQPMVSRAHLRL